MKPLFPFAALGLACVISGCSSHANYNTRGPGAAFSGNAAAYDAYVARRTEDIIRGGATSDRNQAEAQAQLDATRRYGPRSGEPINGASMSWKIAGDKESRPVTMAELDAGLARAKP